MASTLARTGSSKPGPSEVTVIVVWPMLNAMATSVTAGCDVGSKPLQGRGDAADGNVMAGGNRHDNESAAHGGAGDLVRSSALRRSTDEIPVSGTVTPTSGMLAPPGAVVFLGDDADMLRVVLRQAIDAGIPEATNAWVLSAVMEHRLTSTGD